MPSMSRWLVGSSNTSRSLSLTRVRARATRLAWPPDRVDTSASLEPPMPRRSSTAAASHPSPTASSTGPGGQHGHLVEGGDAHAPAPTDGARLGFGRPGEHPQQRRLPAAVEPHDPEPVTGGDGEGEVAEQRLARSAHGHIVEVHEDHRRRVRGPRLSSAQGSPVDSSADDDRHRRQPRRAPGPAQGSPSQPVGEHPLDRRPVPGVHHRAPGRDLRDPGRRQAARRQALAGEPDQAGRSGAGRARAAHRRRPGLRVALGRAGRPADPRGPGGAARAPGPRAPRGGRARPRPSGRSGSWPSPGSSSAG